MAVRRRRITRRRLYGTLCQDAQLLASLLLNTAYRHLRSIGLTPWQHPHARRARHGTPLHNAAQTMSVAGTFGDALHFGNRGLSAMH